MQKTRVNKIVTYIVMIIMLILKLFQIFNRITNNTLVILCLSVCIPYFVYALICRFRIK
jgi:hypothetical protein